MVAHPKILSIVLAGGEGKRLMPLTADRAKPAVRFGGSYRLIDFVLSNLANSDLRQIAVLTQYKSHSLDRHISMTWRFSTLLGNYVSPVPAQQRLGKQWYQGSADAIYQSLNLIRDEEPDYVVVFGADNIYRMDIRQMVNAHIDSGLAATVAGIRVPRKDASEFGVIDADADGKIRSFLEKPADPPGLPDSPDESYASMGNYIFSRKQFVEALRYDNENPEGRHDMGGDIIPWFTEQGQSQVYDFTTNTIPDSTPKDANYWRDVGSIDAFHEAHMDLVSVDPDFNLYNERWPIYTHQPQLPGAKFVMRGRAEDSIVSQGCIISGGEIERSVLSPGVRVDKWANVKSSVLMDNVRIGKNVVIHNAILDKHVVVEEGAQVGVNHEHDRARGLTVSEGGIVVAPKDAVIKRD
ncbi:MAG TPA: glucose-1-phosphate adenylyltransferase [Arachnia sp.]|nr:glucose-1-phosphate adenylyltransferase [Arachnia sp.]HMT85219.1 glucose-1-phosphate adenylyltransferase [Arachnia sp.]